MHHLYPTLKGDQLCPLGFHPQTRYPTRCKRCFRDYRDHGSKRFGEDVAASSPNLTANSTAKSPMRTWTSTQNLASNSPSNNNGNDIELKKRPLSWASTADSDESDERASNSQKSGENNVDVTVRLPSTSRRHTTQLDLDRNSDFSKQPSPSKSLSTSSRNIPEDLVILSTDSLAERVRKMNLLKKHRESSRERSVPRKSDDESDNKSSPPDRPERSKSSSSINSELKRATLPPKKTSSTTTTKSTSSTSTSTSMSTPTTPRPLTIPSTSPSKPTVNQTPTSTSTRSSSSSTNSNERKKETERQKANDDVQFMLKIKDSKYTSSNKKHDNMSLTTETTDTTLVGTLDQELIEDVKRLRTELDAMKLRAERAEREKSDILLRRLASMETAPNRTAATEAIMLQQKLNEMKEQLEKTNEEKRRLNQRMKELENKPKGSEYELKRKLQAAEQLCEELMEENQEAKKEIMNLQAEMEEVQDTFREDETKVQTNLQKELEKITKNCRILSFKLKKSERRNEILEQEKESGGSADLAAKVKKLEEELRFSNDLTRKLQAEADELRNPGKKKAPMLGVLGKSTSADGKITRESLTRGGSQEDPQQLLRDLQDSVERESDLKDQLKFAEEEAENLRKKVARFEDENDSLMIQLKKMATRSRTRKLSPTPPHRLAPEAQAERDEGISDEDDPAELRILLELNEQEASILRLKVEDLEKENTEVKKQIRELQEKVRQEAADSKKYSPALGFFNSSSNSSEKKLKALNDELATLRRAIIEKDRTVELLRADVAARGANSASAIDTKRQLSVVEQEAAVLRTKISTLETENEKLLKDNKRLQLQTLRKISSNEKNGNNSASMAELEKLKETLRNVEQERDDLSTKLRRILQETKEKLPPRNPKRVTDLTPKNHLKKWVEELEDEIIEMRTLVLNSGAEKLKALEIEKTGLEEELAKTKQKLQLAESDMQRIKGFNKSSDLEQKLKKSEEEAKKLSTKVKDLEDKLKKQDNQIKMVESAKTSIELQSKRDKEKFSVLDKDYEKERKEREKLESKIGQLENDLANARKSSEKSKASYENEIKELKTKSSKSDSKQVQELKQQIAEIQDALLEENRRNRELNAHWEKLSEETILMRAQLSTEKQNLQTEIYELQAKLKEADEARIQRTDLAKRLQDANRKIQELEAKNLKGSTSEYEKTMLKHKLEDKEQEYKRLRRENEMNIDLVFQLRKDNDDLNRKLSDFNRIEQAQSLINGHSVSLEAEIRELKSKLESSELLLKSEVASTRLRYEQQVKTLSSELTSMQRQCERFKKDRDAFKQMLDSAQKKIAELKANTGRVSRSSMHSSDDDDKSKIAYLEQQIGCLEDQLVESRLQASKVKTELVSERSANEIKISEMQSKLNEYEEDRVIGSGKTKIPGVKTKLELSWQKERDDQQRLLQETSTLARDLRQTLFEVERERDKERLDAKRRLEQLRRANEDEMEEGRRKIAELQCDLLDLRDAHAKLRTSNEKLRRDRDRYERDLAKRGGGERKVGALLQTVDELVKIAPDLKMATTGNNINRTTSASSSNSLRPDTPNTRRSRSPSPTISSSQIATVLARLAEASEELRKFQRISEDENERMRLRKGNLRRAASQENDPNGSQSSVASGATSQRNGSKLSRSSAHNGSIRKSLSLDQSMQQDQRFWQQEDGSLSSMQSIDSELGGMVRDSSLDSRLDSRLSGGSTQSDLPRGPRKKKKGLMGKLRSLTRSGRNSEGEVSVQGSDSDISVASDITKGNKKDLRNRLSGMFKRSGSTSRSNSTERVGSDHRPVAVTVVGDVDGPRPRDPPPADAVTPKPIRSINKPPTPSPTTPITKRRVAK